MYLPAKRVLMDHYELFNAQHFAGKLPSIPIHVARMGWYGEYRPASDLGQPKSYPYGVIYLGNLLKVPAPGWRGMLLHEMIHAHLALVDREDPINIDASISEQHGPMFTKECNRIGATLRWPVVSVEASWAWPWGALDPTHLDELHD